MSKIGILDEHLTNMIAAGEVVERPLGVVKELVENSIDAQAGRIEIRIVNGGMDSIEVNDDGCGMDRVDATRAFERHATSKIRETGDLWNIHTMGFRGEALPSIASVSKVRMLTSDGSDSTLVRIEYGQIKEARPMAADQGTSILVEGLFYRTPARLKHLKSGNIETNIILDFVQKIALAHPEIAFELYSDDKLRIQTNGSGSLQEAIMAVYGLEVARKCLPVSFSDYDFEVDGYLVSPVITRSNRQYINVSMNGRVIRSLPMQKAIIDGYREFMMPDRFPIVVLNIRADFQLVDVNVHPSKWEIRISKEKALYTLLTENIREALRQQTRPSDMVVEHVSAGSEAAYQPEETEVRQPLLFEEQRMTYDTEETLQRFNYLGQHHGKYILAYDEENIYIIDQHAAMERCMYEEIQQQIAEKKVDCQPLLIPLVIEITPAQMNQLEKINEMLECISLKLDTFSLNSVVVRELPTFIEGDEEGFIRELIEQITNDRQMSVLDVRREKIASMACHASVKFNTYLTVEESKRLLSRLSRCAQPFNCPHGRPTMLAISDRQLEKEFKRV
ncbi:MAG: DNA mismatch repair endonuclease MutL [Erysipelotrichaceae bacterium]|nr:DNA mismatch repair endonuclease MutL [Erysipelotrichaceae bacterium]